jgi:hypothetical protein
MKSGPQASFLASGDEGSIKRQKGATSSTGAPASSFSNAFSAAMRRKMPVVSGQAASAPCFLAR